MPRPLFELERKKPNLTLLVEKVAGIAGRGRILVVTNDAIAAEIEDWAAKLSSELPGAEVLRDGTTTWENRIGAVGDIRLAIERADVSTDLLVIGGGNWLFYDLAAFVARSRSHPASVAVTRIRPGLRQSRFGMVKAAEDGLVTSFEEKPESPVEGFKASCVYYFAASELRWFEAFEKETGSRQATPGEFLEWFVSSEERRLYAVEMAGSWHDVDISGPDALRLREILDRVASTGWEREAARQLLWVSYYEDLLEFTDHEDPNIRIVAARVLGRIEDLLDEKGLEVVRAELLRMLNDPTQNDIAYGSSQDDDESSIFVSATAAESLLELGYADDVGAVFKKAQSQQIPVRETRNVS